MSGDVNFSGNGSFTKNIPCSDGAGVSCAFPQSCHEVGELACVGWVIFRVHHRCHSRFARP